MSPSRKTLAFVAFYSIIVMLFSGLGGSITGIPLQFILKDRLHLAPTQLSVFVILTNWPAYLGFAFGFLRDRWRPLHLGDRGYFLFVPVLLAGILVWLAFGPLTYGRLAVAFTLSAAFGTLLGAAVSGLLTNVSQRYGMTGRISVVLLACPRLVGIFSNSAGGWLAGHTSPRAQFLFAAALFAPMLVLVFWKPAAIFAHAEVIETRVTLEDTRQELKRLLRHRAVYLPAIILFLWAFAPGWGTPLFYYLTSHVKLSDSAYGNAMACLGAGALVMTLTYSWLCCHIRFRVLLYWGTLLGVIGCPAFLLIHTTMQAYVISFLAGASLGVALTAYRDLLSRCCPPRLEGAAVMLTFAVSSLAGDTSDIFGSWLYEKGGFLLPLVISTLFTGAVFAVLPFIPHRLTAPPEGEILVEALSAA